MLQYNSSGVNCKSALIIEIRIIVRIIGLTLRTLGTSFEKCGIEY